MKSLSKILSQAAALATLTVSVHAGPVMFLYDWDTGLTQEIVDNSVDDSNAASDVVAWSGSLGEWTVNVSSGSVMGPGSSPVIDLSSVNISTGDGGSSTLSLFLFVNGLGSSSGLNASTLFNGVTAGIASYSLFQDNANGSSVGDFDFSNLIAGWGSFGPGAFSAAGGGALIGPASLYSLALGVQIEHGGGTETSSIGYNVSVPDQGTTALLLAFGLIGLGAARRRLQA